MVKQKNTYTTQDKTEKDDTKKKVIQTITI